MSVFLKSIFARVPTHRHTGASNWNVGLDTKFQPISLSQTFPTFPKFKIRSVNLLITLCSLIWKQKHYKHEFKASMIHKMLRYDLLDESRL